MSRIVEALYRVSGVQLRESENQYFEENIYNNLPKNIRLKDGYIFKMPYKDSLQFEVGDHAFKHIHMPFNNKQDAMSYAKKHNISDDKIIIDNNGNVYIDDYISFRVALIGHTVNYTINQYEGKEIHNTFKGFPLKMENVTYYIGDSRKDLIEEAKLLNKDIQWPNNVGISPNSIKYIDYIFILKEVK